MKFDSPDDLEVFELYCKKWKWLCVDHDFFQKITKIIFKRYTFTILSAAVVAMLKFIDPGLHIVSKVRAFLYFVSCINV